MTTFGSTSAFPLRLEGRLDPRLNRGLWMVKWLLVLPHVVVLAVLWAAFAVLSLVALVAVVATGRYPRGIFDFNAGVLRWTWRVAYYSYGALGTDRYPPFTLADAPDYPAGLEVDYPRSLSRGLALVKWWLLALPHYLVIDVFAGGAWPVWAGDGWGWGGGSLITLLAVIAGFVLLVTGRYPRPIYDFVLGMNRWVFRVVAYAALMTDTYPPFRLDQGGDDPARDAPPAEDRPPAAVSRPWSAGTIGAERGIVESDRDEWDAGSVRSCMIPANEAPRLGPDTAAIDALRERRRPAPPRRARAPVHTGAGGRPV